MAPAPQLQGMCPEISWVQAGQWAEVCHVELDPESVNWYPRPPSASEQTFVLRVVGESMIPEYSPGTLIYVDPEKSAETGKDVIAVMTDTGEATFKRFIEEPGAGKMLKALNPAWKDPYLPINGNCRVIGVVVADMRMR
ncbi:S24 family peptidase [Halomonas nitroreducens]|uniref:S24 family peptidase n=1 Tax=Halomonas nitroreducens TaxID=447425 RepID=UPI001FE7B196|nr:S24 family peptidase [Halomonas nitroreducens]